MCYAPMEVQLGLLSGYCLREGLAEPLNAGDAPIIEGTCEVVEDTDDRLLQRD